MIHSLGTFQKADLNGDDMITYEHSPEDVRFVWPSDLDLSAFHDKQATLVLDRINYNVFKVRLRVRCDAVKKFTYV